MKYKLQNRSYILVTCLFLYIFIANFLALVLYSVSDILIPVSFSKYLIFVFLPLVVLCGHATKVFIGEKYLTTYIGLTLLFSIITFKSFPNLIANISQNIQFLLLIPFSYLTGKSLGIIYGKNVALRISQLSVFVAVFAILIGIIIQFFSDEFWGLFNLYGFFVNALGSDDPIIYPWMLPRSWVAWDLVGILGEPFLRMTSFFVEPVGLGRLIGGVFLLVYFNPFRIRVINRICYLVLLSVGVFLTLSKSAIIIILFGIILEKFGTKFLLLFVLVLIFLLFTLLESGYGYLLGTSVVNHFSNIFIGLQSIYNFPFGYGIGVDDVTVVRQLPLGNLAFLNEKSEGGFAIYSILFGCLGLLLYALLFAAFIPSKHTNHYPLKIFQIMAFVTILSSIFAHSAFSLVGAGFIFLILGALTVTEKKKYLEN